MVEEAKMLHYTINSVVSRVFVYSSKGCFERTGYHLRRHCDVLSRDDILVQAEAVASSSQRMIRRQSVTDFGPLRERERVASLVASIKTRHRRVPWQARRRPRQKASYYF